MTRRYILFLLFSFAFKPSFGQRFDEYYVPISIDSTWGRRLKFLSDSTVELSNAPSHMGPSLKKVYMYIATDSTIEILPEPPEEQNARPPGLFQQTNFLKASIRLTKIDGGFIDYSKSLIYVRAKAFGSNPDLTFIVDGRTYIQDRGVTNGYGLIIKGPKRNRALEKKLKTIDLNNCTFELVRGLNAYKRFGITKVFGVIVITSKSPN